jgi:hypothetical protein
VREPFQIRVAEILEPEKVVFTNQAGGSLVDQDLTRSRAARKPRGEIHWRPNRRIFKALGTRDRADRHETARDADAKPELETEAVPMMQHRVEAITPPSGTIKLVSEMQY